MKSQENKEIYGKRFCWWNGIREIVRAYPYQCGENLSGAELKNWEAVQAAVEHTQKMPGGDSRLKVIRMLHWDNPRTLTLDGAALAVPCDRATAARWQRKFFEEVARKRELID